MYRQAELQRPVAAQVVRHMRRRYFAQQRDKLAIGQWLASQRAGSSADDQVCDIAIGKAQRIGAIVQHRGEQSIYSGHYYIHH